MRAETAHTQNRCGQRSAESRRSFREPLRACFLRHCEWALLFLALALGAQAQESGGSVSGLVISTWDGSPLSTATVTVRGTTLAVQTDAAGRFQLNGIPPGDQVLRFSKSGFAAAVVTDVRVIAGQTTTVNGNLRPEFYEMEEYEVTAEEFTQVTEAIMIDRQQSSSLMDAIGSEQFSKLGVDDAAGVLGKVTGASVADGKFAVIRGLADRYTTTSLNGSDLPSADPDRKAAQLDLLPSQFIAKMDVRKTFSPDMPAGFAGGAIDIVSRKYPEDFFFTASLGASYNTQASLNDNFLMSDRSSTDWLAMDDGLRALPDDVAATSPRGSTVLPGIKNSFGSRQMAPIAESSGLNKSFSLALGDSQKVLGLPFGYMAGMGYKNDFNFYDNGSIKKYEFSPIYAPKAVQDKTDSRGVIEYNWNTFGSFSIQPFEHHELTFNVFYVQQAEDEARHIEGYDQAAIPDDRIGIDYVEQNILHWTERNLTYFQLKGDHEIPDWNNIRLDWAASTSATSQDEPDQRIFQSINDPQSPFYNPYSLTPPTYPTRYWRELQEDNDSIRGDFTIPVSSYNTKENFVKTGVYYSQSQRDFFQRGFETITYDGHPYVFNGDVNGYLDPTNSPYYNYRNFPINATYDGEQTIKAGYAMADWAALEWLRLTGGARYETTDIGIQGRNLTLGTPLTPGNLEQTDILPSISAAIEFRENLLLRGAWSQTLARPTYREIAPVSFYDPARNRTYIGNPYLEIASSENYDLRLEWYPNKGDIVSLSLFMKTIEKPIELAGETTDNSVVTFDNFDKADVTGIEFEARKNLRSFSSSLEEFTVGFNAAFINSEVPLTTEQLSNRQQLSGLTETTRPLYDQPEYIINGDLTWDHKKTGTSVTLSGGVVGRRLVLVGLALPDDYEEPAAQLDLFISQRLGKHWKLGFAAKNLLNPVYEVTETSAQEDVVVLRSYTKGMTFGLSIGCDL